MTPDSGSSGGHAIAFVVQPYHRGGVTRWMVDAAVEWARRGDRVWFVCPSPQRPFRSAGTQPPLLTVLDAADPEGRIRRATVPVGAHYELGTEQYRASVMLDLLHRHVPEGATVVLSDEAAVWRAGEAVADRYRVVGVLHADDEHYYRLAARYGDELSALVGVSERIGRHASERLGWPLERLARIPCGIPIPPRGAHMRRPGTARLIWVGRIEQRQKRALDLPALLLRVRQLGFDATLDIVGDGPDALPLREAVRTSGVEAHVQWHGWRKTTEVVDLLNRADVLLLPSNFEGMPIAVMEALASGCGVVATAVSGLEDYTEHPLAAQCYHTYPVGDLDTAAAEIVELLRVPPAEREMRARRFAEQEFSIERCIDRYANLPLGTLRGDISGRAPGARAGLAALASLPVSTVRRVRAWWHDFRTRSLAQGRA